MVARLPSLNALRAFEAVARTGSVTEAAGELHVTPGAVSRQVKLLEDDLGVVLLERDGRGVRLSAAGRRCWIGLQPAFAQIAATVEGLRRQTRRNDLVLLVEPVFAATWLLPRLDRFRSRSPETDITIDASNRRAEPARMNVDLVIDYGNLGETEGVAADKLLEEEIFPVCSPQVAARLSAGGPLRGATLLHYDAAPRSWDWPDWAAFLEAVGIALPDAQRGPRFVAGTLVMDAARQGQGVALATTSIAHDDLAAGSLVRPLPESMATPCGYWLMRPLERAARADATAFRTWLLEEVAACFGPTKRGRDR
ncbi:MAG: LysR substrate-binding domain-containing protein [Proteobacteria bacterium]|nr:LysR substrate-binding domain-containing protein [Pseudomonadota bacterium]MDA1072074.1 LysR substrate-binding domain-containing protein [Pseudomonadota bacterium]